jgi:NADH pyrophosphatase NudC (nudix superfamily)
MTDSKLDLALKLLKQFSPAELRQLADVAEELMASSTPASPTAVHWTQTAKTCPKCGTEGFVDPDFGVKKVAGVERAQSWCRACRSAHSNAYKRKARETPNPDS